MNVVYNENLEIGLKEWITFMLKFLNITVEGSLSTLDMIFNNRSYTFCDHCELSKHCFKKVLSQIITTIIIIKLKYYRCRNVGKKIFKELV